MSSFDNDGDDDDDDDRPESVSGDVDGEALVVAREEYSWAE